MYTLLRFWLRSGFIALFLAIWSLSTASAHEVRPAIGDLEVTGDTLRLAITLNAEAIAAGVDLDGVEDTDATDKSDAVDALRALPPEALEERMRQVAPEIAQSLNVTAGDDPVALNLTSVTVGPVGNTELPRDTEMVFEGMLDASASTLSVDWPAQYGTLILRQQGVEDPFTGYLTAGEGSGPIALGGGDQKGGWATFIDYIPVGFDHILPKGLDHILFVLGLFFLTTQLRPLIWQVSAFTLAHTVTLALGALGWVSIPASIVEPLIAASIVYVAVENILSDKLHRWRPIVIFGFGLLHGLGFASVLGEFGLPPGQFIPALIGFNIGVELGQLTVIAIAFALVFMALRVDGGYIPWVPALVGYLVLVAAFVMLGIWLDTPEFATSMGASARVFLWPLAVVSALCALACFHVDRLDAFRRHVAIPCSCIIAAIGAYWFVERVFL